MRARFGLYFVDNGAIEGFEQRGDRDIIWENLSVHLRWGDSGRGERLEVKDWLNLKQAVVAQRSGWGPVDQFSQDGRS